ncbi:glycosyltransferase family 2 protein [Providencia alcalifaciens]|uniref:glycosyltransferase family 2 protein n=1 Tax=Providencia alcalifaciens TaxID=126385 RepID=UPI00029C5572|nr:glycosyltransferase family 2 protein [Providencia alcalifaciens]EKT63116.1 glycosyl transferase family protein [Providencia alcalifaciens Dmel2]
MIHSNITVVIPSFNHAQYLPNLLCAVEKILKYNVSLYIIDDCSKDTSRELIIEFKEKINNDRVTIFLKEKNMGLVDSLKQSLNSVNTEFFYIISSDDIINPDGFIQSLDYIKNNPNMDFYIFGALNIFSNDKQCTAYHQRHNYFFKLPYEIRKKEIFYNHPSPILLQSTIFKTNILKK